MHLVSKSNKDEEEKEKHQQQQKINKMAKLNEIFECPNQDTSVWNIQGKATE